MDERKWWTSSHQAWRHSQRFAAKKIQLQFDWLKCLQHNNKNSLVSAILLQKIYIYKKRGRSCWFYVRVHWTILKKSLLTTNILCSNISCCLCWGYFAQSMFCNFRRCFVVRLPNFHGIVTSFEQYPRDWNIWYTSAEPENTPLPGNRKY